MTTPLNMVKDMNGNVTYGSAPSNKMYATTLSIGVAQTFTAPTDSSTFLAVITPTPGGSIYVSVTPYGRTLIPAVAPGGSVALTNSQLNPAPIKVGSGDSLSIITTDATCVAMVKFYSEIS